MPARATRRPLTRRLIVFVAVAALSACSSSTPIGPLVQGEPPGEESPTIVTVRTQDVVPAVNLVNSTVQAGASVAVELPVSGVPDLAPAARVVAGQSLGTVDGQKIISPASGSLTWRIDPERQSALPAHYPLAVIAVDGFAVVSPEGARVPLAMRAQSLTGKAQVGVSGAESSPIAVCVGVGFLPPLQATPAPSGSASSAQSGEMESQGHSSTTQVVCQLPLDAPAFSGDAARFVLAGPPRKSVTVVPLTAVVGRGSEGSVTLEDGTAQTVALGATDGQYVEVLSGLTAGQAIRATPLDLAPLSP